MNVPPIVTRLSRAAASSHKLIDSVSMRPSPEPWKSSLNEYKFYLLINIYGLSWSSMSLQVLTMMSQYGWYSSPA